jgi:NAD+ kinase
MIVALFPNEKKPFSFELAEQIRLFLEERHITVVAEDSKATRIKAKPLSSIDPQTISFLISMGGDGTLLRIAHQYRYINVPILGINLGHLGFMADIPIDDIFPSLTDLLAGKYSIDKRIVLEVSAPGKPTLYAVNDVVLHRAQNYSLIELSIHAAGIHVNTFFADGLIIATPNGSTAYSLAAGGPIVSPALDAMIITPICPHTISYRPIVLTSDKVLEVKYLSKYSPIDVRSDGLDAFSLEEEVPLTIRKSPQFFPLINLHRHEYFSTLRSKLGWFGKIK